MRSIYSLPLALTLVLLSSSSWALGLGEITVTSKLGENFNASIPITDTAEFDAEQIKASNATADIYKQHLMRYKKDKCTGHLSDVLNRKHCLMKRSYYPA